LVQEEDTQPLSEPIIKPITIKKFHIEELHLPETNFSKEFLVDLTNFPHLVRNIAIVGHLSHGKTTFIDHLIQQTHTNVKVLIPLIELIVKSLYTDTQLMERDRSMSIKSNPISLVLSSTKSKSFLINIMDTPGHINFVDEVMAAFRISDGVVIILDVVEGVMLQTEMMLKQAVLHKLKVTLVINKMDRLILELKLPPMDAYFKIKHAIQEVNAILNTAAGDESFRVGPELGNVCFASGQFHWSFTLNSFAKKYTEVNDVDYLKFGKRLWGDVFYNVESRTFERTSEGNKRTFVHFILEPLYKIYSIVLGSDAQTAKASLASIGVYLKLSELQMDVKPLLTLALSQFFGPSTGFVDMVSQHIPDAKTNARNKIERIYTGPLDGSIAKSMLECDAEGPLMINVVKNYASSDGKTFSSLGRIFSGTVKVGGRVRVLGEGYTLDDEEDSCVQTVSDVSILQSQYRIKTKGLAAGSWCLLDGVDATIVKTATITDTDGTDQESVYIFAPLKYPTMSIMKIAIEPVNPIELPKMLDGLRKINKTYPLITTRVEESGEHIVLGTGEMYLDCVMHDLRRIYSEIEIKIADPIVRFAETVVETSSFKCFADTPNKKYVLIVEGTNG
jgi:U5 small nuclear ribonucleoprotein component